jgi:hypothetical protein
MASSTSRFERVGGCTTLAESLNATTARRTFDGALSSGQVDGRLRPGERDEQHDDAEQEDARDDVPAPAERLPGARGALGHGAQCGLADRAPAHDPQVAEDEDRHEHQRQQRTGITEGHR